MTSPPAMTTGAIRSIKNGSMLWALLRLSLDGLFSAALRMKLEALPLRR
jgi:hypothetical protein